MVDPALPEGGEDPSLGEKAEGGGAENPQRHPEIGLHLDDRRGALPVKPMQIPPPAPVGGEHDATIRRPLRLEDGFIGTAGDLLDVDQPVLGDGPRLEESPVPGHVGVIPFQPEELRRHPRRAEERRRNPGPWPGPSTFWVSGSIRTISFTASPSPWLSRTQTMLPSGRNRPSAYRNAPGWRGLGCDRPLAQEIEPLVREAPNRPLCRCRR